MIEFIFSIVSLLTAAFAFGLGAIKLFKKKKPLYLQILVCAAGCFAIEQLSLTVNLWCGVTEAVSIGLLGIFGCNFFLLSANFGTLDKIVDDGKGSKTARQVAFIAPVIVALLTVATFVSWKDCDMFCAVMLVIMLIPALPASYFNLKHILLPLDPFEFLKATKPCNISALSFYLTASLYAVCSAKANIILSGILLVLMSLSMLALSLSALWGAKKWGI